MIYESYLYHHGITGQKWGKRNGPPYPLDRKTIRQKRKQARINERVDELNIKKDYANTKMENSINEFQNSKNAISAGKNYIKADLRTTTMSAKKLLQIEGIAIGGMSFAAIFAGLSGMWYGRHS